MFTGIIENLGKVVSIENENTNIHFWIESPFIKELKIDQSIAHNGVCLTVVEIKDNLYKVTAIQETLIKTNLSQLKIGNLVNLERCLQFNGRIDGHLVQGHVDQKGIIKSIENKDGSHILTISYDEDLYNNVTVEKGSICINGISLTVINSKIGEFSVAIIPYTWEFTNLHTLTTNQEINLEFDILGKYIKRLTLK